MKRFICIIFVLFCLSIFAPPIEAQSAVMGYTIENGDTIYHATIPAIYINKRLGSKFKSKRDWKKYYRMVYNLPKVYPYAQIAKNKLAEMNKHFETLKTKRERKEYIKTVEAEMLAKFKVPLKKLTRSQGKMLIKLFNRETGQSAYALVKEMKGGFATFFWQNIASLFGLNLKTVYDGSGEDAILEELVQAYERGEYEAIFYKTFGMSIAEYDRRRAKK